MNELSRFPQRLNTVDDLREPLRPLLQQSLPANACVHILVDSPPSETERAQHGHVILAVTTQGWTWLEEPKHGGFVVHTCDFARTILVEMTSVLLTGVLRIVFVKEGGFRSLALEYAAGAESLYWDVLRLVLHGIHGWPAPATHVEREVDLPALEAMPQKFLNTAWNDTLEDEYVRAIVHWPAAVAKYSRWFRQELAPEAMFVLTDRELIFITEEMTRWSLAVGERQGKYGDLATCIPFSRLRAFRVRESEGPITRADIMVGANGTTDLITIEFPSAQRDQVDAIIARAFRVKATRTETLTP